MQRPALSIGPALALLRVRALGEEPEDQQYLRSRLGAEAQGMFWRLRSDRSGWGGTRKGPLVRMIRRLCMPLAELKPQRLDSMKQQ